MAHLTFPAPSWKSKADAMDIVKTNRKSPKWTADKLEDFISLQSTLKKNCYTVDSKMNSNGQ
jgi:hypothetical protein